MKIFEEFLKEAKVQMNIAYICPSKEDATKGKNCLDFERWAEKMPQTVERKMAQLITGNYKGSIGWPYAKEDWFKGKGNPYLSIFTTYKDNYKPDTPERPQILISIWDLLKKYKYELEYFNKKLDKRVVWDGKPI